MMCCISEIRDSRGLLREGGLISNNYVGMIDPTTPSSCSIKTGISVGTNGWTVSENVLGNTEAGIASIKVCGEIDFLLLHYQ